MNNSDPQFPTKATARELLVKLSFALDHKESIDTALDEWPLGAPKPASLLEQREAAVRRVNECRVEIATFIRHNPIKLERNFIGAENEQVKGT